MADLERTVAIIFEGVDQMGSGIDSATKQIDGLARSVQGATQPLASATIGVLKFEAALVATGAAVTAFAVKLAGDFDSQFREISTLIDAPAASLEEFRGELLAYGRDSTQSLEEVNSAVYGAISAGVDYTQSLDAVRQAEKLAVAGRASLSESNTLLVSSLNAYGASAEEAERYSDLLFQTVRSGQTTLPELAASLSQVTGVAAAGGVEFDELLAAVATLTATGAPTSQAVTQIRGAISALLKPTAEATTLAADLGIEFNAAALETQGLAGVLDSVAEATGGNTEQMAQLFGSVEALNGVLTLTGTGADKFASTLLDLEDSAGATAVAYEKMAGDIENGTQRIQNAMTGALIGVGTPLLDEFGGIQEAIAAIFNAIGASVEGGQLTEFVNKLESLFQGIETTLREVAENLPAALEAADFSGFFDGIQVIQDAVAALFDGANLSSAEGLVTVIETLGLGFEALAQYTASAITQIGPFLEKIAELAGWFLELDPAVFATAGTIGGLAVVVNTLASAVLIATPVIGAVLGSSGLIAKGAPIVKALIGVLSGPLGLAVAVGLAGTQIVSAGRSLLGFEGEVDAATQKIIDQNNAIDNGSLVWDHATNQWAKAGEAQETLAENTARLRQETNDAILGIDREGDARERQARLLHDVNLKYADFEGQVEAAFRASQGFAAEQEATADSLRDVLAAIGPLETAWKEVSDGVFTNVSNVGDLKSAYVDIQAQFDQGLISQSQFDELTKYFNTLKTGGDEAGKSQQQIADAVLTTEEAILKARRAVLDYELSLEELASNERIKKMEFTASINVAQIESDADKVESILSATSEVITGLGGSVGGLLGTLADPETSRWDQLEIERAIDQQMDIQREAADQQKRVIDEQIKMMRAKTQALQNNEGLIKIDSTGLEPALEMIMWEIIEKVQLRANAEGSEFLLGI